MSAQIQVWSDYVCPFCLIADELIERATTDRTDVEVVHHPHELRPRPMSTLRPEDPYLPDIWQRAVYPMARRHGVSLQLPGTSPQPYPDLAFRGAQYAADHARAGRYHRRVMTAFFREDRDIGDRAVLARLAEEVGLARVVRRTGDHAHGTGRPSLALTAQHRPVERGLAPFTRYRDLHRRDLPPRS